MKDYRKKRTGNGWADRYGEGQGPSYEDQEVIVDPVTGETRPEPRRQNDSGHHHHFPAPWADDADAPSPASENLSRRDTDGGELGRRSSRASLGSRYAERYGLGGDGSSENSGRARRGSRPSSLRSGSSTSHAGGGGGLFGRKKAQGKDRWAREADVMGPSHGDVFGADDMGGAGPLGNEYDQGRTGERTNGRTAQPAREEGQRRTINDPMEDNFEF